MFTALPAPSRRFLPGCRFSDDDICATRIFSEKSCKVTAWLMAFVDSSESSIGHIAVLMKLQYGRFHRISDLSVEWVNSYKGDIEKAVFQRGNGKNSLPTLY